MNRFAHTFAVFAVAAFAAQAHAEGRWLAPARVTSESFRVGLLGAGGEKATAQQATLVELPAEGPLRVFEVRPQGRGPITLQAGTASAKVELGPPEAQVRLEASPPAPVKGVDETVTLSIAVLGPRGTPDPEASAPVLRCNVGSIEDLRALGQGRFQALYRLPRERHPEVAIVVALAPWPHADAADGAFGALAIPLSSAVNLPGKTEPRARITVEIAGRQFGPAVADEHGAFTLPVVVPPGHKLATSVTTDALGNRRRKPLDLHLPPTDQLACVANPPSLPADGRSRARVVCLATDPFGAPLAAKLVGRARQGRLSGPKAAGGAFEWEYTAPRTPTAAADDLEFDFPAGGAQSRERFQVALRPGLPRTAEVSVTPQPVFAGTSAQVEVRALDAEGRPVPCSAELGVQRGTLDPLQLQGPLLVGRYRAPSRGEVWQDQLSGEVRGPAGIVPARLRFHASPDGLRVGVADVAGAPVPGQELELAGQRATSGPDGLASFMLPAGPDVRQLEVRLVSRPSLRAEVWQLPTGFFPSEPLPQPLRVGAPLALAPPAPIDLQIELAVAPERGVRARLLDLDGRPVPLRELSWSVTRPDGRPVPLGPPREEALGVVFLPFLEPVSGPVGATATDLATGVGVAEEATLP